MGTWASAVRYGLLLGLSASTSAWAGSLSIPGTNLGAIPDGAGAGPRNYGAPRDIRFDVTGVNGTLTAVGVQFAADHPFVGDLKVSLIAPTGVEHLLFESTGATTPTSAGSPANLVSANPQTFLEAGSNWWTNAGLADANIPASTSRSVVAGPVAVPPPAVTSFNTAFLNQPANGTWILRFQDGWSGDVGSVTSANLLLLENGATRTVTKVADTNDGVCDADCSLREAIAVAAPGDLVAFASPFFDSPRAIVLGGTELAIDKSLAIAGPGAHRLTISANRLSRVFAVSGVNRVTLTGMRLTDGNASAGGAIRLVEAALLVSGCEISNSRAGFGGGILANASTPSPDLRIYDSSIIGNVADDNGLPVNAGGILANGSVKLVRVTVSGNHSPAVQGAAGVYSQFEAPLIEDTTVTGNRGGTSAGGVATTSGVALSLRNSVLAGNRTGSGATTDIGGTAVASLGYNLIGDVGGVTGVFIQPGDQAGTAASPLDPKLGPLSHNGGTVPVHAPLQGSPLLDKGKTIGSDARGVARAFDLTSIAPATGGNNADIGAVEVAPLIVTNTNDSGLGSLRQAIADAPVAPAVSDIWFDPSLTLAPATITLSSGQLSIDRNLAIHGPGAQRLAISGNRQSRVIAVQANRRVGISGLTLTEGNGVGTPNSGEGGGALNAEGSHFSVVNSVLRNHVTETYGGAIRNRDGASLVLRNSSVIGNRSNAAAVASGAYSAALISSSTISQNRMDSQAALFFIRAGSLSATGEVKDSTITDNVGSNFTVGLEGSSVVSVQNTLVAGNQGGDLTGPMTSLGHNLIGNAGTVTTFTQPGDQTGTAANPLDPKLSPLAIHSGQVPTHMPLAGSPALDKGLRYGTDQRGLNGSVDIGTIAPATGGNNADIGAVEAQAIFVSTANDSGAGSLRQAILDANANGPGTDDVLFSLSLPATINLSSRLPQPTGSMNFDGPGAQLAVISRAVGAPAFGLLDVFQPVQIGITRLGFSSGLDDGSNGGDNFGGAIDAFSAELHLTEVEINSNQSGSGAGLSLANADGVISDSTISNNIASVQAGGIYFQGDNHRLIIRGSTIGGNGANGSGLGGGINHVGFSLVANRSLLEVSSSTIAGNAAGAGAGIRTASGTATSTTVTSLRNTLFANNLGSASLLLVSGSGPASVVSNGYNLSDTVLPLLDKATDRTNVNPQLGILQYNSSQTRTYALLAGSAAIDGGIRTDGINDQRGAGFQRTIDLSPANAAGGDGTDIGAFEVQTEPVAPPTVVSIVRASANPATPGSSVAFTVSFSASVTGVDSGDFALTTTGVSGATITGVSGSGSSYTVSVNVGTGSGTLRLDLVDNDSIVGGGLPLGGTGAGNGSFTSGEVYTVGALPDAIYRNGFE
ncbi:MAG: CSLREA domain-containing protein [Lysobacterales bacterium]